MRALSEEKPITPKDGSWLFSLGPSIAMVYCKNVSSRARSENLKRAPDNSNTHKIAEIVLGYFFFESTIFYFFFFPSFQKLAYC